MSIITQNNQSISRFLQRFGGYRELAKGFFIILTLFVLTAHNGLAQTRVVSADRSALPRDLTLEDHLFIMNLDRASAPQVLPQRREIVFTYAPPQSRIQVIREQGYSNQLNLRDRGPIQVFIAFGHEQFRILRPMDRSPQGIFFYYFDYDRAFLLENRQLDYRFVVDGVWMEDSENPMSRSLLNGVRLSTVLLPEPPLIPESSPQIDPAPPGVAGRNVRFFFQGQSGRTIHLAGTFNAWDPFLHRMQERADMPGLYEITLQLPPGEYHYHFVSQGRAAPDPLNGLFGTTREGVVHSRLVVPR